MESKLTPEAMLLIQQERSTDKVRAVVDGKIPNYTGPTGPTCKVCNDTHVMPVLGLDGRTQTVNCLYCQVPCRYCWNYNHLYCDQALCTCGCHKTKRCSKQLLHDDLLTIARYALKQESWHNREWNRVPFSYVKLINRYLLMYRTLHEIRRARQKTLANKFYTYLDQCLGIDHQTKNERRNSINQMAWDLASIALKGH